jgi:dihydroneopterin aldolase
VHGYFTHSGWRAMILASEEARNLGHKYVGTEHVLLGLLWERYGVTAQALEALDVAPDRVRERVIHVVGSCVADVRDYRPPLTPKVRRVLKVALEEALRFGHDCAGAEHILLGLVGEPGGVAAQVLYKLGASPDEIRREVERMLGNRQKVAGDVVNCGVKVPPPVTIFRGRVEGLVLRVRCGVADEERARPQALRVDLDYLYEAEEGDDLLGTVDYGALIESVARLLEREEFGLLETGARIVGEHVLNKFPSIRKVTVAVTKLRVPVARAVSEVSVKATFGQ